MTHVPREFADPFDVIDATDPCWCLIQEDVLVALMWFPDAFVDFVFTDVPYGLGNRGPTPEEILAYLQGASLSVGDFMGEDWEIPSIGTWKEILRCAKPGAHLFSYGGTRTWDLISMGIRMAGFQNRDTIAEDHPALRWTSAEGMAKGQNVSKAIDRAAGAVRPIVGTRVLQGTAALSCKERGGTHSVGVSGAGRSKEVPVTESATDEAKEWDGWGSCLAPTWEPILVFRKPIEGSLADNTLKYGTGPIHIDACRTYTDWNEADRPESWKASGHSAKPDEDKIAAPPGQGINCHPGGRWPKNNVLVHAEGCQRVGSKKVDASPHDRHNNAFVGVSKGADKARVSHGFGDSDGTETVDDFVCVDGCPVRAMEIQAGNRKSGARRASVIKGMGYGGGKDHETAAIESSSGSVSRFFPCFESAPEEPPFFYCSKTSRLEREIGCESLPPGRGGIRNIGKCVKPQALCRWLARLGCRPGGLVLVPYAGTGSEVIACVREGMRVIAIEKDPAMIKIAKARLAWWAEHPGGITREATKQAKIERVGQCKLF